jgi:SAM-dependent methyltransferase
MERARYAKICGLAMASSAAPGSAAGVSAAEVLAAYDRVSTLYPFVPPLSLWRAWECAAYARFSLPEPVLDVGCGDGAFFRFLWPAVRQVVGVERDPGIAARAQESGVYTRVVQTSAHLLQEDARYASAFANCSLEHMDDLPAVLGGIRRSLRPGGILLGSVVTDGFARWLTFPEIMGPLGAPELGEGVGADYLRRQHVVNPLTAREWQEAFQGAGLIVREHIPIVPEVTARVFLTLDQLWHLPTAGQTVGTRLERFLASRPGFPRGFRQVLAGLLEMEAGPEPACGAVFLVERPSQ